MKVIRVMDDLVDKDTGEVIGYTEPRIIDMGFEEYEVSDVKYLEPMTAQELDEDKLIAHLAQGDKVAEQKFDGHRGLIHLLTFNRMFSRRVSKKTNWFSENTDQVPQIRDIVVPPEYYGTVIDGEILLPVEHCTCREVQGVTGALPATAIDKQLSVGFAYLSAFDILYYKGVNIMRMPYWKRKLYLLDVIEHMNSDFVKMCTVYTTPEMYIKLTSLNINFSKFIANVGDYNQLFTKFLKEGKEGLIIKDINAIYEQKRSKAFVKMKAHETYDCVIMGYDEPTKEYDGKEINKWTFWEKPDGKQAYTGTEDSISVARKSKWTPVTKFYTMGWIGAIRFGVWKRRHLQSFITEYGDNWEMCVDQLKDEGALKVIDNNFYVLVEVGKASGMDEEVRKELSDNQHKYMGTTIEVMAQGIINKDTGSLQHPRFIQFRPDKDPDKCTFDDHIGANVEGTEVMYADGEED